MKALFVLKKIWEIFVTASGTVFAVFLLAAGVFLLAERIWYRSGKKETGKDGEAQ